MRKLLLLGLMACGGDDSPATPDAGPTGPIQVHVQFSDEAPAPGIDIVFHDAAGEVVSVARSGADGVVEIEDPTVSMVSIAYVNPDDGKRIVWTKTGLRGGHMPWFTLAYAETEPPPPPEFMAMVDITVPPNPPGGATTFAIDFGCAGTSGGSTHIAYTLQNDCRRSGANELDVVALAKNGETVTGYAFMKAVPIVTGGTTVFDFPTGWRTDPLQVVAQYSNVPATATQARLSMGASVGGNPFYPFTSQTATVPPPPSRSYIIARGFYTSVSHSLELDYGGKSWGFVTESAPTPTMNSVTSFDLGGTVLPEITDATLADATTTRPTITWIQAGPHDGASGGFAGFSWTSGSWQLQLPPDDATSVRVPALPAELAAFLPPADGSIADPYVSYDRYSYEPTYADHLARHGRFTGEELSAAIVTFPSYF